MRGDLYAQLLDLIGPAGLIRLAETYGGTRLYVPLSPIGGDLEKAVGTDVALALAGRFGGATIRTPLARELRARHYRAVEGLSNAAIARRLGMTETGINLLFANMTNKPAKGSADPRQLDLFKTSA